VARNAEGVVIAGGGLPRDPPAGSLIEISGRALAVPSARVISFGLQTGCDEAGGQSEKYRFHAPPGVFSTLTYRSFM
jgi:hypothetical protein